MNSKNENFSLEEVLEFYQVSSERFGEENLEEWIARYPQYENELREFSAYKKMIGKIPPHKYTDEEEQLLTARAVSVVQNLLYQQRQEKLLTQDTLTGLIDEIESQNSSLEEFVAKTSLSKGIIRMLDRRQIHYKTIALKAIENISEGLNRSIRIIKAYLQGAVRVAPSHYMATQAPEPPQLYDFSEIVQIDGDLTAEQKAYWLSQAPVGSEERHNGVE